MKTFTKIIFIVCFEFLACNNYETERNNPFDPRSKNSLYYIQLLSGNGISGLTGNGAGNSGKPDLQLVSFSPPSTMLHENTYTFPITITNAGTSNASSFYISGKIGGNASYFQSISGCCRDFVVYSGSVSDGYGQNQIGSLAVGETITVNMSLKVPSNQTTGIQYIGLYIDSGSSVTESNETNNYGTAVGTFIQNITVSEWRPDITIVSFNPPSPMTRGSLYNLSATITNSGNRDNISAFYVSVGLGVSLSWANGSNCSTTASTNTAVAQVGSLASGASTTINIPLTVNAGTTIGINYIGICFDSGNHITEYSNGGETNNYGTAVGTHIKQVTVN